MSHRWFADQSLEATFLPLHSSELQHSSAHTEFPGSFQGCCFSGACSLCHKHKHQHGMCALALAAPSPLGIQEIGNATDAGREPPCSQSINRHKPHMSLLCLFPTPLSCKGFLFHLWGHQLAQKLTWHISCEDTLPRVHFSSPSWLVPLHHQLDERIQGVSGCLCFNPV